MKANLDLTPEEACGTTIIRNKADYEALQAKIKAMADTRYPFIDVWSFNARLSWMVTSEDGNGSHVERFTEEEQEALGITEDMLYAAIEGAGGAINISGHYPISEEIREKLQAAMQEGKNGSKN